MLTTILSVLSAILASIVSYQVAQYRKDQRAVQAATKATDDKVLKLLLDRAAANDRISRLEGGIAVLKSAQAVTEAKLGL